MSLVSCELECDQCKKKAQGRLSKPIISMKGGQRVTAGVLGILPPKDWLLTLEKNDTLLVCSAVCAQLLSFKRGQTPTFEKR